MTDNDDADRGMLLVCEKLGVEQDSAVVIVAFSLAESRLVSLLIFFFD
jgi:hypothetical protein